MLGGRRSAVLFKTKLSAPPPAVLGTSPPTLAGFTPDIVFHPHTATLTLRGADSTFFGYVQPFDSVSSSLIVVAPWSVTTCDGIRDGSIIQHASLGGSGTANVVGQGNVASIQTGKGGLGQYLIDKPGISIGSTSSPQPFTMPAQQVVAINDLTGNSTGLVSPDNSGPVPIIDDLGRRALRFRGTYSALESWMQNTTYNVNGAGCDSHNVVWFFVCRVLDVVGNGFFAGTNPMMSMLYPNSPQLSANTNGIARVLSRRLGNAITTGWAVDPSVVTSQANRSKMYMGHQIHVSGAGRATPDGYNASTNPSHTEVALINEHAESTTLSKTRILGINGYCINAYPQNGSGAPSTSNHPSTLMDVYYAVGFFQQQLGNDTQLKANMVTVAANLMASFSANATEVIIPLTVNYVVGGDSRTEQVGGYGCVPSGNSIGSRLCDPGAPGAFPAHVRVMTIAQGGEGLGVQNAASEMKFATNSSNTFTSVMAAQWEMPSPNKNILQCFVGHNDIGATAERWPTTAGAGGTNAFIDDLYVGGPSGLGYSGSFTGSMVANARVVSISAVVGTVIIGSVVLTGLQVGMTLLSPTPPQPGGTPTVSDTSIYNGSTATGSVTVTVNVIGIIPFCKKMLARNWYILWVAEPKKNDPTGATRPDSYLAIKMLTNAVTDVGAGVGGPYEGKFRVYDPTLLMDGGVAVCGNQANDYGLWYFDAIHNTERLRKLYTTGGDDTTKGLRYVGGQLIAA